MKHQAGIIISKNAEWALGDFPEQLSSLLNVPIVYDPTDFNYIVSDIPIGLPDRSSFIPLDGIRIASDKRKQMQLFSRMDVPTPETHLIYNQIQLSSLLNETSGRWVLKYPTSCGGTGHRVIEHSSEVPDGWPTPLIIQSFVEMDKPEVHRIYSVAGEMFGWNVRRLSGDATNKHPWVSHSRGAEYTALGPAPKTALNTARLALQACGLVESFGCVDLIDSNDEWLVLEVGTDGNNNFIDRDVPQTVISFLDDALRTAFQQKATAVLGPSA